VLYPARTAQIELGVKNILSVRVPTITIKQESLGNTVLPYGFADTSSQLDIAIVMLAELLPRLIQLAELEKTCDLLADEIEKTRRRVNALEYVMIPQFEETVRYITMKLDENERSALTRLMKVKDMMLKQQEQL
jgi:V/A-type H+-transporting ATPase subunit D